MKQEKNTKTVIYAAALAILTFLVIMPFIDADDLGTCQSYGMMSGFYGRYGISFMIISWVIAILIILLISAAIYWLIKSANRKIK